MNKPHILIAGAGLGGLTAGIALAQRGFSVDIFEAAAELREVGAGLTVSRSAQAVFAELGLLDRVRETASLTKKMAFLHYIDGRMLAGAVDDSDGRWTPEKGEGGIHIHRADMHALLAARFEELAPGRLHLGKRLIDFRDVTGPVEMHFADGSSAQGDMLIGADGIRSAVRQKLWGGGTPRFTGQVAYRFMMPGDIAAPFLRDAGRAAVFQGPGRVFNRYTLRRGAIVNCVGITQADGWDDDGSWSTPANVDEMLALYNGWHPDVTGLMALAPPQHLIKWALFDRPSLPGWLRGRTTLLGDAAHPMLPFLGLGAAMAIEDAMVLARALGAHPDIDGLALYEDVRRPRVEKIAELSRIQGELSQQRDPAEYDPKTAPAQDPGIQDYDPVTIPLAVEQAA
ncbi:FAD-dependent monooxygenase [Sphingobium aromaticivastans]|uniref:FAD-dependent monooxygenase n=1 Tax=Sphingobium aromaticivastans TaxID=1778665 RepID=UPI0030199B41